MGAVITQGNRTIAFFIRKLSETQQQFSVTKIELLTIVETLKEFKGMLWGQRIMVYGSQQPYPRGSWLNLQSGLPVEIIAVRVWSQYSAHKRHS